MDGDDWLNTEELPAFVELLAQVDTDVVAADFLCVQDGTEQTLSEKHATSSRGAIWMYRGSYSGQCDRCDKMHALTIQTRILQEYDIVIDEHCYYVDCEYITYPIPYVKQYISIRSSSICTGLGRNGQSMDIRSMQKNREQHMRVLNSPFFLWGRGGRERGTLYYIERCIAQVVENQFQIYISMGRQKRYREIKGMGSWIKEHYPGIYAATRKKSITMLRKTGYRILPIGAMVYQILKTDKGGEHE